MQAFFIDPPQRQGQRFCIHYPAQGLERRGQVLYLHPFAEEMNKARRMSALQARALAQAGFEVLQIDLLGCGDSSGDFGDASWEDWVADGMAALAWLRQRRAAETAPLWLWGLRAGCLLATEMARRLDSPCHLLLVQPPASGKLLLQQFLRLKVAAGLMEGGQKGVVEALRQSLAQGDSVEIAGYRLSAPLAAGLEAAQLAPPADADKPPLSVVWLELSSQPEPQLSPVATQGIARWRQAGHKVDAQALPGPAFWQSTEIETAPALIDAGVAALLAAAAPQPAEAAA